MNPLEGKIVDELLGSGIGQDSMTVSPSADPRRPDVPNLEDENIMGYKLSHASAFAGRELSPTLRFVLRTICDYTNDKDDTNECFPSVARIVESTSFSERTVRKAIADLQEHGYLTVFHQAGKRSRYFINLKGGQPLQEMHPCETFTPATDAPLPLQEMQGTPAGDAGPYNTVNNQPSETVNDVPTRFRKPSVEEVCEYMKSRNWKDPQGQSHQFVDYNASRGWMVGKSSMKDWKAAVRTWEFKNPNLIKPTRNDDDDDRVARL